MDTNDSPPVKKPRSSAHRAEGSRASSPPARARYFLYPLLPPADKATLDVLARALGPVDDEVVEAAFEGVTDAELVDEGDDVGTESILESVPTVVYSTVTILQKLTLAQEDLVMMDASLPALIVQETQALAKLKAERDASLTAQTHDRASASTSLAQETRRGVALRDRVRTGLVNALGPRESDAVQATAGTAETTDALATGLESLAKYIRRAHETGTERQRGALTRNRVTGETADALDAKAAELRRLASPVSVALRQVSQSELDRQDGRVLFLIEKVTRALRTAHRQDRSISLPELRSIAWKFTSRSGKRKPAEKTTEEPAGDAPKPQ
jgi:hypothetical protein